MNFPVDWAQTFAIIGSMLAVWYAFYQITDKRIDRMETHHREDTESLERRFEQSMANLDKRFEEQMDKNEGHWREMFMYMSDRIGTKGQ